MHFSSIGTVNVFKLHGKTQTDSLKITAERPFKWPRTGEMLSCPSSVKSCSVWISRMMNLHQPHAMFVAVCRDHPECGSLADGIVSCAAGRARAEPSPATELSICELSSLQFLSLSVFLEVLNVFLIQSPHGYWWAATGREMVFSQLPLQQEEQPAGRRSMFGWPSDIGRAFGCTNTFITSV